MLWTQYKASIKNIDKITELAVKAQIENIPQGTEKVEEKQEE